MDTRVLLAFAILGCCAAFSYANSYGHGHGYHEGPITAGHKNEYRPHGNKITLDNGYFGYNPNDGTYGQPHKHNAKRGYGGYGNLLNNGYGFGFQYGVLGRAEAKGYSKYDANDALKDLNRRQLPYYNSYS